jgi:hypothetical protein
MRAGSGMKWVAERVLRVPRRDAGNFLDGTAERPENRVNLNLPGMLLITKRREGVFSGNWFEGSQVSKARPGAPSVSPFDFAEGTSLVISLPTRHSEPAARDAMRQT